MACVVKRVDGIGKRPFTFMQKNNAQARSFQHSPKLMSKHSGSCTPPTSMRYIHPVRLIAKEFFLVIVTCHGAILHPYHIVLDVGDGECIWRPSYTTPSCRFAYYSMELELPFGCFSDNTGVVTETAAVFAEDVVVVINGLVVYERCPLN